MFFYLDIKEPKDQGWLKTILKPNFAESKMWIFSGYQIGIEILVDNSRKILRAFWFFCAKTKERTNFILYLCSFLYDRIICIKNVFNVLLSWYKRTHVGAGQAKNQGWLKTAWNKFHCTKRKKLIQQNWIQTVFLFRRYVPFSSIQLFIKGRN